MRVSPGRGGPIEPNLRGKITTDPPSDANADRAATLPQLPADGAMAQWRNGVVLVCSWLICSCQVEQLPKNDGNGDVHFEGSTAPAFEALVQGNRMLEIRHGLADAGDLTRRPGRSRVESTRDHARRHNGYARIGSRFSRGRFEYLHAWSRSPQPVSNRARQSFTSCPTKMSRCRTT